MGWGAVLKSNRSEGLRSEFFDERIRVSIVRRKLEGRGCNASICQQSE
jgi:hypothetical protein